MPITVTQRTELNKLLILGQKPIYRKFPTHEVALKALLNSKTDVILERQKPKDNVISNSKFGSKTKTIHDLNNDILSQPLINPTTEQLFGDRK